MRKKWPPSNRSAVQTVDPVDWFHYVDRGYLPSRSVWYSTGVI